MGTFLTLHVCEQDQSDESTNKGDALKVVEEFVYLGSTISSTLSRDRTRQEDWQGSNSNSSPDQEGVRQRYAAHENHDGHL